MSEPQNLPPHKKDTKNNMYTVESARQFLIAFDIFFGCYGEDCDPKDAQTINLNDVFGWACADCEYVEDNELPRLAELVWKYGNAGALYWVANEKRNGEIPEFYDIRRQIEFVAQEEAICKEEPVSSRRAYLKKKYTIGE